MKSQIGLIFIGLLSALYANESYYKGGKLVELQNMHISKSVNGSYVDYFKNKQGHKIGVTDDILVQCKDGVSCSKLLNKFNLINYSKLTDKIFIIKIKDYDNIFSISRKLFESGDVEFAHPNFIQEKRKR
ncbi:MAG: hypothetical protein L3I99_03475 [Sulfurimonas sp.]|nr:hypothetical protein [Sulfurimonas sp.]